MKSILLPTDGTVPSEEAALYAMDMAKRLRAKVKALYAVDDSLIPLPSQIREQSSRSWRRTVKTPWRR